MHFSDHAKAKMKTCTKCKVEKDESEFSKQTSRKDGLDYRCKSCLREYRQTDAYKAHEKAYHQTDAFKASIKAYQQTDAFKASQKAYKQTDAVKASKKAYRQTDDFKASLKAYQQTDAYKEYQKQAYQKRKALAASLPGNADS